MVATIWIPLFVKNEHSKFITHTKIIINKKKKNEHFKPEEMLNLNCIHPHLLIIAQ